MKKEKKEAIFLYINQVFLQNQINHCLYLTPMYKGFTAPFEQEGNADTMMPSCLWHHLSCTQYLNGKEKMEMESVGICL